MQASISDSNDIYEWRNDKLTRQMSSTPDIISWETHRDWYINALTNPDCYIYIGYLNRNEKLGMCRFDIEINKNFAEISININPNMRGNKLSTKLLLLSIQTFNKKLQLKLKAKIKKENKISLRIFKECGFVLDREDNDFYHLVLLQRSYEY